MHTPFQEKKGLWLPGRQSPAFKLYIREEGESQRKRFRAGTDFSLRTTKPRQANWAQQTSGTTLPSASPLTRHHLRNRRGYGGRTDWGCFKVIEKPGGLPLG